MRNGRLGCAHHTTASTTTLTDKPQSSNHYSCVSAMPANQQRYLTTTTTASKASGVDFRDRNSTRGRISHPIRTHKFSRRFSLQVLCCYKRGARVINTVPNRSYPTTDRLRQAHTFLPCLLSLRYTLARARLALSQPARALQPVSHLER